MVYSSCLIQKAHEMFPLKLTERALRQLLKQPRLQHDHKRVAMVAASVSLGLQMRDTSQQDESSHY